MKGYELIAKLQEKFAEEGLAGLEVKVRLDNGDIVEIIDVDARGNGAEWYVVTGLTEKLEAAEAVDGVNPLRTHVNRCNDECIGHDE